MDRVDRRGRRGPVASRSSGWLPGICVLIACHGAAAAAEPTAEDDPTAEPRNFFSLNQLDAYLEFDGQYDRARVKVDQRDPNRKGFTQHNRDLSLEEKVGLRFDATILDPGFIALSGEIAFGLTQDRFKEQSRYGSLTEGQTNYLLEYDLRANLFQGKQISGSVYGLQRDDRISRRFQSTLREDRTAFGTSWFFSHEKLPMELTYDYAETDRTGNRDALDDEHFTESTLHFGGEWIVSEYNRLKFSFEHSETKQEFQGLNRPFETTRDLITLDHEVTFGDRRQNALRTLIHAQQESGDFARDFFEIGPQLSLQHGDDLQTLYKYQFNRERFEGLDIETHRADFQIVHQVYSNLTTTFDAFGLYEDVEDDVKTKQYGAAVDWQYNRRNPYGHLHANLAIGYDTERARGDDGARLVLDEAGTFRDPTSIILRNYNAIRNTILVTDTTGRRRFIEGVDYRVSLASGATRLTRVRTGRIPNGTTVLIDYRYRVPTRGKIDTLRVDLSIEQRFNNKVTPYYRLSYRNQEDEFSTGFARTADRTNHHRIGVRYEAKRYTLGAEFELFDDSIEPYDAFHLDGLWHIAQTPEHSVDASGRLSRFFFEGGFDRRNVTILDVELDHRWRLGETLSSFERLTYRWEDDSVDGTTNAWDAAAGIEYTIGDFTAELSMEYDRLALPDSTEDDVGIWIRIRRDIPNVLARW